MGAQAKSVAGGDVGVVGDAPPGALPSPEVHVTVATLPRSDITGSLEHDAGLVKAAALYADRVTLASPNAIMLAGVAGLTAPDSAERRDALIGMASVLPGSEDAVALYEDLKRRRGKLRGVERIALMRMEKILATSGDELGETVQELLEQAGMPDLERAMEAGVLGIHMLDLEDAKPDEFSSRVIDGLVKVLVASVSSNARTYPLFDDGAGGPVSSMVAEGLITDAPTAHSNEVGVAGRLIGQLEAFPTAEMDVVLDVRKQLRLPLIRFRAALARVSSEIESPAWETEAFAREAEDIYHRHVAPALAELEAAMQQLGALPTLRRVLSDQKTLVSSSALMFSTAAGVGLAHLPHAVFGGGAAASLGAAGLAEAERRSQARRERESNDFYFLYQANCQLRD